MSVTTESQRLRGEPPPLSSTPAPRELEVAQCIAKGMAYKQIAEAMGITAGTVKVYAAKLRERLGIQGRMEIAAWVEQQKANAQ